LDLPAGELFVALQVLLAMRTGKLEVTHKKLGSVAQACLSGSRGAKDKMRGQNAAARDSLRSGGTVKMRSFDRSRVNNFCFTRPWDCVSSAQ